MTGDSGAFAGMNKRDIVTGDGNILSNPPLFKLTGRIISIPHRQLGSIPNGEHRPTTNLSDLLSISRCFLESSQTPFVDRLIL